MSWLSSVRWSRRAHVKYLLNVIRLRCSLVLLNRQGLEETPEEQIFKRPKAQQVVHKNTHFQGNPFSIRAGQSSSLAKSAALKASLKSGRVGHDGKEIASSQTPKVNGYGFVGTPSPAPGNDHNEDLQHSCTITVSTALC